MMGASAEDCLALPEEHFTPFRFEKLAIYLIRTKKYADKISIRHKKAFPESEQRRYYFCVFFVSMLSKEFVIAALLTAVFGLCGVLVPKMREMSLNRIGVDNQAVVRGCFWGLALRKYVDGIKCRQTEQRIGAK